MRTTQEVFRHLIRSGRYGGTPRHYSEVPKYMCKALAYALEDGAITQEEHDAAVASIMEYIGVDNTRIVLRQVVASRHPDAEVREEAHSNSVYEFSRGIGRILYWYWDKRPELLKGPIYT